MSDDIVVGVDLGTTNTCVSYFFNKKLKIIENSEGEYTTPSYVFFDDQYNVIVGEHAQILAATKPENGIYEIKRFIGRRFDEVNMNLADLPFSVKELAGQPFVRLQQLNRYHSPEDISSHILLKVKNDVSRRLGKKITKAVITVPAHFNVLQRKATLLAAKNADITVLKLLSEPTAAALTYFYEVKDEIDEKYCLVYDLGGGTFDVAIVEKVGNDVNIIGVDGDSHLGGQDFDNAIFNYVCEELEKKYEVDVKSHKNVVRMLRNESRKAKELLSDFKETPIILEGVLKEDVINLLLSRTKFEEMVQDLIQKTVDIVERCIKNCKLTKSDIGPVVLVGGSTRVHGVKKALQEYFDGKELSKILHPEECVAKGAALQAAVLSKNPKQQLKEFKIKEVISSSLGVENVVHRMDVIINKNTPVPVCETVSYGTIIDQQEIMCLKIFEGEKQDTRNNTYLGMLKIYDLTPAPPGKCRVSLTMNIDENGILTLTAKEKNTNNVKNLELVLIRENKSYFADVDEDDPHFAEFAEIKEYLLMFCIAVQHNFEMCERKIDCHEHVYIRCQEIQNEIIKLDVKCKERLIFMGMTLIKICNPVIRKCNFKNMNACSAFVKRILNNF